MTGYMLGPPKPDFRSEEAVLGTPAGKPMLRLFGEARRPQALGQGADLVGLYNRGNSNHDRRVVYQLVEAAVTHAVQYGFVTGFDYTYFCRFEKGPEGEIFMYISPPLSYLDTGPSVKLVIFYLTVTTEMEDLPTGRWPKRGIRLSGPIKDVFFNPDSGRPIPGAAAAAAGPAQSERRMATWQQTQRQRPTPDAWALLVDVFGRQAPISTEDLRLGEWLSSSGRHTSVIDCTWRGQNAVLKVVQPLVVGDKEEELQLQLLLANEAKLYSGPLAALQGTSLPRLMAHGFVDAEGGSQLPALLLSSLSGPALDEGDVSEAQARSAVSSLRELHLRGFAHGDVSLANFVRASDGSTCVIVDLGLAYTTHDEECMQAEESGLLGLLLQAGVLVSPPWPSLGVALAGHT